MFCKERKKNVPIAVKIVGGSHKIVFPHQRVGCKYPRPSRLCKGEIRGKALRRAVPLEMFSPQNKVRAAWGYILHPGDSVI